jgi:hypothetical protein
MAQDVKTEVRIIVGGVKKGPGRFDLMLGLFEGKVLTFTFNDGQKIQFCVTDLGIESGGNPRQDWIVMGYVPGSTQKFEFYYCSDPHRKEGFSS